MVKVEIINYGCWGRCVRLYNETIEVIGTLDFGPRIIRFGFIGGENMLYEDLKNGIKDKGKTDNWKLYGGHRLWISPEIPERTYYADDFEVELKEIEKGVILTAPVEKATNIQKEFQIEIIGDNSLSIVNRIRNKGLWTVELAPWAVTVMAGGGKEIIPLGNRDTGYLPNRVVALWPYTRMQDKRLYLGNKYIALEQSDKEKGNFKIGINNEEGWAAYFNHNNVFVKTFNPIIEGNYPDYGVNYETFTNEDILEMEVLGELVKLEPNEEVELSERWYLISGVSRPENREESIEDRVERTKCRVQSTDCDI